MFYSPLQDVTLHRMGGLGSLVVEEALVQEAGPGHQRGHRGHGGHGRMSPVIGAGAGCQSPGNTRFRLLFRADLNTWNDNG